MTEVIATDEFVEWYRSLDETDVEEVTRCVDVLEMVGMKRGSPQSSAIKGSKHPLRELRVQSRGRPLRVFYAFDPKRQAVLLLGGDKTGDKRFYKRMVPIAEGIWKRYLAEIGADDGNT